MNKVERLKKESNEFLEQYMHEKKLWKKKLYEYIRKKYVDPAIKKHTKGLIYTGRLLPEKEICERCGDLIFCPKHVRKNESNFLGTGNHKKDIMFILQNPGKRDKGAGKYGITNTRLSCTGGASILRLVTDLAGYDFDEDIYCTNTVKCCTSNNNAEEDIIRNCRPFLKKEIEIIKPKKIVVFGNKAKESLDGIEIDEVCIKESRHPSYAVDKRKIMKRIDDKDLDEWMFDIVKFLDD